MPKVLLKTIVAHCDKILRTREIGDYEGAANGLQVENSGAVIRIAAAVDASLATINLAVAAKADLLIVHHGLFWSPRQPWTGKNYELLRFLVENNLAVYSSHLPLDAHPKLGNNAQLCAALGLRNLKPFFTSHGQTTKPAPAASPATMRINLPGQPASSGHNISTGDTNSSCPLNMHPTPSSNPAAIHQSSVTRIAATKKNGGNHESHCGQP